MHYSQSNSVTRKVGKGFALAAIVSLGLLSIVGTGGGGGGNGDEPGTLQFSASSYSDDEDAGAITVTVTRTGGSTGAVTVDVSDADSGAATSGTDYTVITTTTLSWADGVSGAQTFTVDITNDTDVENNETINLTLSGETGGATLGMSFTTLTITNEDACTSTADDSVQIPINSWTRIHSESFAIYHLETLTRETTGASGPGITMDYMVHEPPAAAEALLVLIAGGQLNASIQGTDGNVPTFAGGNFLVRSAHLFAAQGYRVLTIDRPNDYLDYTGGLGSGYAYDGYRTSMAHAVDLSQLINMVNAADNLPVIIAGTSRGSISAVAQHELGTALAISAPVTSGSFGTPIGTANVLPANVSDPVHVSWHVLDGCGGTQPANAKLLVGDFPDATGVSISGGFASSSSTSECNADHYHGFPGIESCAAKLATDWMAVELASLPATRPVASAQSDTTTQNTQLLIDLTGFATNAAGGALSYSLPHASTSLGGSISIAGTSVTYVPPNGVSSIVDTFVYVVSEAAHDSIYWRAGKTGLNLLQVHGRVRVPSLLCYRPPPDDGMGVPII
jgi:hypothetical protein